MSKPYKEVNPGDPILATDWNAIQSDIRQHILTHTHTGTGESGAQLDITALTFGADMAVRKLSVSDSLAVGSANQPLLTVNPTAPNQEGNYQVNVAGTLRAEQVRTSRLDGITNLAVGALAVAGNVGIGVADAPTARLEVNGDGKFSGPVFMPQLIGDPARESLEIIGAGPAEAGRKITLWAEGGATVQGGLTVYGAPTVLADNLTVAGATTLNSGLTLKGELTGGSDPLTIASATVLTGSLLLSDTPPTAWPAKLEVALPTADSTSKALVVGKGATNYLTVLNNGNVGLGLVEPGAKLEVRGGIRFGDGAGAGQLVAGSTYLSLRDNNNTDRFTILQSNGNVGIGTITPGARLAVSGADATVSIETAELVRLLRPAVSNVKNSNSAGFRVGAFEQGISGRTRLDMVLAGAPGNDNAWGATPNVTVMTLLANGNAGIGTTSPANRLQIDNGRVDITTSDVTGGGQNRFNGLLAWNEQAAYRRGQLVLSSSYSDLVIASSHVNDNHGSTLTFATYNPSDAADYRKWVINQGNWGARKQFLDFGYADANGRANPHNNISATDTVLTVDGINKRVGIGTTTPGARLSFKNADSSELADGITWFNPTPTSYGIYRTAGAWSAPNYQQLRLNWLTGIVLDPGTAYDKSYVDIQGNGLRVTAGNVGIGTASAAQKLMVVGNHNAGKDPDSGLSSGGQIAIKSNAPQLDFIDTDHNDWSIHVNNNRLYFIRQPWEHADLVLDGAGNVGIGTVSPGAKLEVNGAGKFTGALTIAGNLAVPGGDETLRMLRGIVNSNGTVFAGSGFSVSRAGVGLFDITFNTAFPSIPGASATQIYGRANSGTETATHTGGSTLDNVVIAHLSANMMRVKTGGDTGAAADRVFSFIVIGPR